ncbi:DUF4190 domain-containing protein [Krasilnikovia sp. MM14-A1259]|uniref:DUF4190 domain-containing protein n=1 Tax=Krasilnikovia sp. MM14-A1259 TaxID=3373539 RepID=UPI003825B9A2
MTYPPPGGTPDPYQPQQPYEQPNPYSSDPYAAPGSGAPASGQPYLPPTSGQPSYPPMGGQPYGQSPYGTPQYAQPYAAAPSTNTMAILALVFAFIFSPAAIVMGHVAKKQIRQTGEGGEGLATAGLWLGYIFTGLYLLFCVGWIVLVIVAAANGSTTTY